MAILPSILRADVVNLKVVSSPLVVSILGGSGRSVGYGSNLILNSRWTNSFNIVFKSNIVSNTLVQVTKTCHLSEM